MYTVLLIEDQFDVASLLRLVLSRNGYRALLASNLSEAENIWAAFGHEIHAVITDNSLPDGSGLRFAEHLTREKPALKVIVASGLPTEIPPEFERADKPFHISKLLQTLERLLPPPDPAGGLRA
jgi:DNA-binding NtrC family response regulator